jgi:hypothetical protein
MTTTPVKKFFFQVFEKQVFQVFDQILIISSLAMCAKICCIILRYMQDRGPRRQNDATSAASNHVRA